MAEWFSIEVIDGIFGASHWADAHGDSLVWRAQEHGATDWGWAHHSWGVVFEVELPDEAAWEQYLDDAAVQAALDAVPNPAFGVITYRGRGGSAGARDPRRPRPLIGAGSAALPVPVEDDVWFEEPERRVLLVR